MQGPHLLELVQIPGLLAQPRREVADVGSGIGAGVDAPVQVTVTGQQDDVPALPPGTFRALCQKAYFSDLAKTQLERVLLIRFAPPRDRRSREFPIPRTLFWKRLELADDLERAAAPAP